MRQMSSNPEAPRHAPHARALVATTLLCAATGLLGAIAATGCGDEDAPSDDAVAEIGDARITKSEFEGALMGVAPGGKDPRDYSACVKVKLREGPAEANAMTPTRAALMDECKEEYVALKKRVMENLIRAEWTRQEAEARNIVVTDADVQGALDEARESGFLSDETLERSSLTMEDLLPRVREAQLGRKVAAELAADVSDVSAEDVARYYSENRAKLRLPERRDLRLILTRTQARARAAWAALEDGQSWARVAKEYSLHEASRDNAGRVEGLREKGLQSTLVTRIFRAMDGELTGPIETDESSWAVFVVERIKPSVQPRLEEARPEIAKLLTSQRRREAVAAFTEKYRDKTTCAPRFRISLCKNDR
jgi:foldase protein PrsA